MGESKKTSVTSAPVGETLRLLESKYPDAKYYLNFSSTLELLVGSILSTRTKDGTVNALLPVLSKKYKTATDYAQASQEGLMKDISPVSSFRHKARFIRESARIILERHGGVVPSNMEDLLRLPGIGRKTANTILVNGFWISEGIPTDTHVIRIANKLGWSRGKEGDAVESDLMSIVPKEGWKKLPYQLKAHGRALCKAPIPVCSKCMLSGVCPKIGVGKKI
jgi:endonuclease III